ncbi:zinc finger protein 469 [Ochotona princeps]|uniref:zinc finger protein 469 n=1 Tax=Ochotona princeps TaxID=9978 RepID=UPI002714A4D2|nr:zinc finger protein 469 [Ochotona princeps]
MTRDLLSCHAAGCLGRPFRLPREDPATASRTQAGELEPKGLPQRPQTLGSPLGKGDSPQVPPKRSHCQAHMQPVGKVDRSPPQPYSLDESQEGPQPEAPQGPGPGAPLRPNPEVLTFSRCCQESTLAFTSPNAPPGPPGLQAPQSRSTSPGQPASYPNFQVSQANPWPPVADSNFPGANFGVPPSERETFLESSKPGSPGPVPFPYPTDTARREYSNGAPVFPFQPQGLWPQEAVGSSPAYTLPCYPPSNLRAVLSPPGAAHGTQGPFPEGLHKSLTKVLPERPSSAHNTLGSPRRPPEPRPQGHLLGQAYRAGSVGTSPGPLHGELAVSGPPPATLPQLWDSPTGPYPTPTLAPPATARSTLFKGQPGSGQGLCLPQSPSMPWSQPLPTPSTSPHQLEVLSRLPFPGVGPKWQGGSQDTPGTVGQTPGPGEKLVGGSPGLFTYSRPKDPGAQPLFFGGTQPQVSPCGTPSLPPPRVVGASPAESPLPSPATQTAGSSTCSSLSPPSSSPANPSSEEGQLPAPLGPLAFFHPHPQETSSPFLPPEPSHPLTTQYQAEPAKAFSFAMDGLGAEGPFPQGPPPYAAHHFPLSSASLDQLDVLLTCKQCDRNYSSLATFLAHRPFCSLPPARAKDSPQPAPGLHAPTGAPKAPTDMHTGSSPHAKAIPFLLPGGTQASGREDPLQASFLPSPAATPFPLPGPELDLQDEDKLDSLITEALNGMGYQSDTPDIDSTFIDVFADEEPSGPRGVGAGHAPKSQVGVTTEHRAQPPLTATDAPCPRDRGHPPPNRPKTRSLGLEPTEVLASGLVRPHRRGKQLRLFRKDTGTAGGATGDARQRPRRRRKIHRAVRSPAHPHDLRAQAPKSHATPETRSSGRLRLPPGRDSKRKAHGSGWSKGLMRKVTQQRSGRQRQPSCAAQQSDKEQPLNGSGLRGRPLSRRGPRRKGGDLAKGASEGGEPQKPKAVQREEGPRTHSPPQSPEDQDAHCCTPQVPTDPRTTTPDEPLEAERPEIVQGPPPDTTDFGERLPHPAAPEMKSSPRPPDPEQPVTQGSPRPPAPASQDTGNTPAQGLPTATPSNSNPGCDHAHQTTGSVGTPGDHPRPPTDSSLLSELWPAPQDRASCFPEESCSAPLTNTGACEPELAQEPPCAGAADLSSPKSPLTLESTSLFPELALDGFDSLPIYSSLCAHRDPQPEEPPMGPLRHHPLLLLCDTLPNQLPDLVAGKAPSPPPGPSRDSEPSAGSLSEDELEIRRLVSELESQLQHGQGPHTDPSQPGAALGPRQPSPGAPCQARSSQEGTPLAADSPGPGEGALGSPPVWPCAAQAMLAPDTRTDLASEAPVSPPGASCNSQRRTRVCLQEPLPDASPGHELLLSPDTRPQKNNDSMRLPPRTECTLGPREADVGPGLQGLHSPAAHLASEGSLDALSPPGPSHTGATPGRSAGKIQRPQDTRLLHLRTEEPGLEGDQSLTTAPQGKETGSVPEPSPACEPSTSPGGSPWDPASSTFQGASTTGSKDCIWKSQRLSPADQHSPPCGNGSEQGGASVAGESVARSPTQESLDAVQVAMAPVAAGHWPGPKADGHPSQHPSGPWETPERPDCPINSSVDPVTALAGPAGAIGRGSRAVAQLRDELWATPNPTSPGGDSLVPVSSAAHTQNQPQDRSPGQAASLGPCIQLLGTRKSPAWAACSLECLDQERSVPTGELANPQRLPAFCAQAPLAGDSCVQAPTPTEASPPLAASPCGPLLEHSGPLHFPRDPSPAYGRDSPQGSTLSMPEDSRQAPPGGSPPPGGTASPRVPLKAARLPSTPTSHEAEADSGVLPHPQPKGTPMGPCPGLQSDAPCHGHSEARSVVAEPTYPTYREGEARAGSEGPCLPVAVGLGNSSSSPTGDCTPKSPQRQGKLPHQKTRRGRQRPHSFKREAKALDESPWSDQTLETEAGAVTCSACQATFRSGPALSRHRARKHRLPSTATSQLEPAAQEGRHPGRKSRKVPMKVDPSHTAGQPGAQHSPVPGMSMVVARHGSGGLETAGLPPNQQPQSPGLTEQGADATTLTSKPTGPNKPGRDKCSPKQVEKRKKGGQGQGRESRDPPASRQGAWKRSARKPIQRRPRGRSAPPVLAVGTASDRCDWSQSAASARDTASAGHCPSPEGQQETSVGPGVTEDMAGTGPGVPHTEGIHTVRSPGGGRSRARRTQQTSPEPQGASAKGLRALGMGPQPAAESPGCLQDSPEAQEKQQGSGGDPHLGPGKPGSLWDDEDSFAQLFPMGGRRAWKKTRRVYGKRLEKASQQLQPSSVVEPEGVMPPCVRLPTDLTDSDSGSLCLAQEDLWDDEAPGLAGSFLLDSVGTESWNPGLGLWAAEPDADAHSMENNAFEAIPELHMVPVAWRSSVLQVPTEELSSQPGAASPGPPSLERECWDPEPPGNASLPPPPLQALDFLMLSNPLQSQDPCAPVPCEDTAGPQGRSPVEPKAAANSAEPLPSPRTMAEETLGTGGERPAKGTHASYKCKVCFQRFHGLRALDLHRLAHSPAPPPTCYMCVERRFGSRQLLREHLQEKHGQGRAGPWVCGMCLKEVAGVWMYNEHLREHAMRFARQGRARGALGDRAVTRLLHSLAGRRRARPQGSERAAEPPAVPEDAGREETPGERPWSQARADASNAHGVPAAFRNPAPAGKAPRTGTERLPQAAPCRDPSRDCHHCGKRFPKPFKLQRHLAVHSPQRVYLCPRCPHVYPEPRQLRAHLGEAHGQPAASEPQHTPLYTCELCADVLQVIKRCFVCSSCNYTFAKKEQLERHVDKHLRLGQQPIALRRVRRPGLPEGAPARKRRKVPRPEGADRPPSLGGPTPSEGVLPVQGRPKPPVVPVEPLPALPGPSPGGPEPDHRGSERSEGVASPVGQEESVPLPDTEENRAPRVFSGKRRAVGTRGQCAPGHSPARPSPPQKEQQTAMDLPGPEAGMEPPHRSRATKPGGCRSLPKDGPVTPTPSKVPRFPGHPSKAVGLPAPQELAQGTEGREKFPSPKDKLGPSSRGSAGPRPGLKAGGGSQPQPSSGQLQSETASTPGKPNSPGQIPALDTFSSTSAGAEGPRGDKGEKKRKSQAPELSWGTTGPEKPPRAPRKQAAPSRLLPLKPSPGGQSGHLHSRGRLGKVGPPLRRARAVLRAAPTEPRQPRTAASQSDLLSQLFGQRTTNFKIPLKRDPGE